MIMYDLMVHFKEISNKGKWKVWFAAVKPENITWTLCPGHDSRRVAVPTLIIYTPGGLIPGVTKGDFSPLSSV